MQELDDLALLREYVERGSGEAFAALVQRHIHKVYSVALRHARNPNHAEEITQTVFVIFATKARALGPGVILSGWFYETARRSALTLLKSEIRRARREGAAHQQTMLDTTEPDAWAQIAPLLDEAMDRLSVKDRHAVVLRFFDGKNLQDVGAAFGTSEEAAKKRVQRAVEKLRQYFMKRGVVVSTTVVLATISAHAVQAAPPLLAKSVLAAGLTAGAASGTTTWTAIQGGIKFMAWTKLKMGLGALVVAGLSVALLTQQPGRTRLVRENASLRGELAELRAENSGLSRRTGLTGARPHLPAPRNLAPPAPPTGAPPEELPTGSLFSRLLKAGSDLRLTAAQVDPYLRANGRNAGSLLAAFRTTGDRALLQEALRKYPTDPQVDFAAAVNQDLPPEERRKWLDEFKKADPDNALANHLSALNYFAAGSTDEAVQELIAASGKQRFQDYSRDFVQNAEEAYLAAGYPPADAKTLATTGLALPQLADLRQLGQEMVNLAASYRQSGDASSAQATLQIAAILGQGYSNGSSEQLASQLVGMQIETMALNGMSPETAYGAGGATVQDRLNQLRAERASLRELTLQTGPMMEIMSDQDWLSFNNRLMVFGEASALQWLANKYGTK